MIRENVKIKVMLNNLNPLNVVKYLEDKGWNNIVSENENINILRNTFNNETVQIVIPLTKELEEYEKGMRKALITIGLLENKEIENLIELLYHYKNSNYCGGDEDICKGHSCNGCMLKQQLQKLEEERINSEVEELTKKQMSINEKLLKIINRYGVMPQLKYLQTEFFELTEANIDISYINGNDDIEGYEKARKHIAEEIADTMVMIQQFKEHYEIKDILLLGFMQDKLLPINTIEEALEQVKYMQGLVFDFNKAVIETEQLIEQGKYIITKFQQERKITKAIANIYKKLDQLQKFYKITDDEVLEVIKFKVDRQLDRINNGK